MLSASTAWEISGKPEWVDFSPNGGSADVKSVKMKVRANENAEARSAEVKFLAGNAKPVTVKVEQAGLVDLKLTVDTMRFGYPGGKQILELQATAAWIIESKPEWCEVSEMAGEKGGSVLDVTVGPNDDKLRAGKVVFKMGEIFRELVVEQESESMESILEREREVLLKFYNALNGNSWSSNYGWDNKTPVSEWAHVTVNDAGRVTKLIFDSEEQGLSGKLISDLKDLEELEVLRIDFLNGVTGNIPAELGELTKLKELTLKNGQLTGNIPESIFALTNLTKLNFYTNRLDGEVSEKIRNLSNLTYLDLSYNQLRGKIDLTGLNCLESVFLSQNNLSGTLDFLPTLTSLVEFHIYKCKFTGEIPLGIGELKNLEVLQLSENNLEGDLPKECVKPEKMRLLDVGNNRLKGLIPEEILNWEYRNIEIDEEGNETVVKVKYDWTDKYNWERICLQQAGFGFDNAPAKPVK
ncbi:MAG: BACON domain-containing protein [Odoribacter splanchnicus]